MRSVVVVLPASICAMIPMLRVVTSSASLATALFSQNRYRRAALVSSAGAACRGALPAVVREGLVGVGHLVGVFAALHARTQTVARVQQLVHQPLGHRLLPTGPAV